MPTQKQTCQALNIILTNYTKYFFFFRQITKWRAPDLYMEMVGKILKTASVAHWDSTEAKEALQLDHPGKESMAEITTSIPIT